jgi:hypothetical protein
MYNLEHLLYIEIPALLQGLSKEGEKWLVKATFVFQKKK